MSQPHDLFISHSSQDDALVRQLRIALEAHGVAVWADSRELTAGDGLTPTIQQAIQEAGFLMVVFSGASINAEWVLDEIDWAKEQGKMVIPLCLPAVKHTLVKRLLGKDALIIEHDPAQPIGLALLKIFEAMGRQLPDDRENTAIKEKPFAELLLKLSRPAIHEAEGIFRPSADAELIYHPADPNRPEVRSNPFRFIAPLGPIERGELAWYLEHYFLWPVGVFKQRGEQVEEQLPAWGQALYQAALGTENARKVAQQWRGDSADKRFSIEVDGTLLDGTPEAEQKAAQATATALLALPWELLHNGAGWLFQGGAPAQVRRRLPNRHPQPAVVFELPIRVLLVSPRPEQEGVGYIDHRVSAAPLVEALAALGELAELSVLNPPSFPALQTALQRAQEAKRPFHVVHFDGHGVYDQVQGLGALCFEDPADVAKLQQRRMALVNAKELAAVLQAQRIPLVFLEACQSAQSDTAIEASVAGSLLQQGVGSVVAMSHSVLVETARRFVGAFYGELARGARVGQAMRVGQLALHGDPVRGRIPGAGELRLHDWFVPVLYQEQQDPQLFQQILPQAVRRLAEQHRRRSLGALPETPAHRFVGRSRELLALERLLTSAPYALLRGQGGQGKTTLAVELARWLVNTGRFRRALFVSLEEAQTDRALLDALGRQLLPKWSVAEQDFDKGIQQVERALRDAATLIVVDNCESVLPALSPRPEDQGVRMGGPDATAIFALAQTLGQAAPHSRLLFTSRERLPEPFTGHSIELGPLSRGDALQLLAQVLAQRGIPLPAPETKKYDQAEQELTQLVESLHHHARALVLLAPELARRGLRELGEAAREILAELERRHPGERENSLYASIELSLRRLPEGLRGLVAGLGVLHGGGHLFVIGQVLEVDEDTARNLAIALIQVGLAEDAGYGHLRLDPALPAYLGQGLDREDAAPAKEEDPGQAPPRPPRLRSEYEARHAAAMERLLGFLHQQQFKDAQQAAQLTLLEVPNLLALLRRRAEELAAGAYTPAQAIDMAKRLETLLAPLGRPQGLAEAVALREEAASLLAAAGGAWGHADFLHASSHIDRLLQQGNLTAAYQAAQGLLQDCLKAQQGPALGEGAAVLAYDTAMAYMLLGRVLNTGGAAQAALEPLAAAQQRFETLAQVGNQDAARMASVCLTDTGDCLRDLGRLEAAAQAYEERIARGEKLDDQRGVAVGKGQLGTVRLYQRRYP